MVSKSSSCFKTTFSFLTPLLMRLDDVASKNWMSKLKLTTLLYQKSLDQYIQCAKLPTLTIAPSFFTRFSDGWLDYSETENVNKGQPNNQFKAGKKFFPIFLTIRKKDYKMSVCVHACNHKRNFWCTIWCKKPRNLYFFWKLKRNWPRFSKRYKKHRRVKK